MKQFSLEKYLANPERKIVTRDGQEVRIICIDRAKTDCPVVALVMHNDGHEDVEVFSEDGRWIGCGENPLDLFFSPNKYEGWLNLYRGNDGVFISNIYPIESEKEAKKASKDKNYVASCKITWEE